MENNIAQASTSLYHDSEPLPNISTTTFYFNCPVTLLIFTDRLYLASYIHPPTADTVFPYSETPSRSSPSKRSQKAVSKSAPVPKTEREPPCYFTVDDTLLYNAFHHDFGPLHIGHLYRFALHFHDILAAKENQHRPIVFWSRADPRSMLKAGSQYDVNYTNNILKVGQTHPVY